MNRRSFVGISLTSLAFCSQLLRAAGAGGSAKADLIIVGGGFGGCAAALAACRAGLSVVMTEDTDWIGGQVTSQGVPPDEHPWIEQFGCTRAYRTYRDGIRAYYGRHFPLTPEARANPRLNPGNGSVSRICHEPRISLAVLSEMLAPYVSSGKLRILLNHKPQTATTDGDRVTSVTVVDTRHGHSRVLTAPYYIDATELGDLLPLARVEYVIGAEARSDTGEPHAPETAAPLNQQAITWCFAMDHIDGEDHTLSKPDDYAFWKGYVPEMKPAWPGPLLSWATSDPYTLKPRAIAFNPIGPTQGLNLWVYRRIVDPALFAAGTHRSAVTLVNWPQNDYWLGPLVDVPEAEQQRHLKRSRDLSRCLLYWMQTEAPRPDGGTGWKGLRLREDVLDGVDGLAKAAYIREARRILPEFRVTEEHVSTEMRMAATGKPREEVTAAPFDDSVGIGCYRIDLHPSTGGDNYIDLSCLPFQIPLGALLPRRVENLIPACKNLGVTHITNGAYRLHPVEWNIGEAAGELVVAALAAKEPPRQIWKDKNRLTAFQQRLRRNGFELEWPRLRPL